MTVDTFILTIFGGLIVGVIVLYIEYHYFQRRRKERMGERGSSGDRNSWDEAQEIAIKSFKRKLKKYKWVNDRIEILHLSVNNGLASLDILITSTNPPDEDIMYAYYAPVERYLIKYDRTGCIIELKNLPMKQGF